MSGILVENSPSILSMFPASPATPYGCIGQVVQFELDFQVETIKLKAFRARGPFVAAQRTSLKVW
jgi:hypothetical protein